MKKILLITFTTLTLCLGGVHAQTATIAPAPLKPKWTCRFTNPITFSDGPTANWSASSMPFAMDAVGNVAVYIESSSNKCDVLWISSKGVLLAAIPAQNTWGVLNVSANSLYLRTDNNSWEKYSLVKGKLVRTLPPGGDYLGIITLYPNMTPTYGVIGITQTDNDGWTKAISFFPF
jgi:hypothetical protein